MTIVSSFISHKIVFLMAGFPIMCVYMFIHIFFFFILTTNSLLTLFHMVNYCWHAVLCVMLMMELYQSDLGARH